MGIIGKIRIGKDERKLGRSEGNRWAEREEIGDRVWNGLIVKQMKTKKREKEDKGKYA